MHREVEVNEFLVEVKLDNVPDGTPVEIVGLGVYPNGMISEIPDDYVLLHRLNTRSDGDPMDDLNFPDGVRLARVGDLSDDDKAILTAELAKEGDVK